MPTLSFAIRVGCGELPTGGFAIRLGSGMVPTERFAIRVGLGVADGGVGGFRVSSVRANSRRFAMLDHNGLTHTYPFASADSVGLTATFPFGSAGGSGEANGSVAACPDPRFMATGLGLRHFDPSAAASTYVAAGRESEVSTRRQRVVVRIHPRVVLTRLCCA